ncbi:MAG: DUF2225 domain-containing protein [Lachnospiraceae bacterium]|nr:DUF2225 domain-containing protein [Lachnospiraceae bacterium]
MSEVEKLFDKKYTCPVCDNTVLGKTVRTGKARLLKTDMDLRNVFEGIEPLKYEVILCPKCGYAALAKFFDSVTSIQQKYITEKITPNFKPLNDEGEEYSYEQALSRYNIAYANAVVKMAKASEGAYICLKSGWLCRSYKESLEASGAAPEQIAKVEGMETDYLKKAYAHFTKAVQSEDFPICGMDENTVDYLMAVLAMECGEYSVSSKLLSKLLTSPFCSNRVKDKARDVKEVLVERMKEEGIKDE